MTRTRSRCPGRKLKLAFLNSFELVLAEVEMLRGGRVMVEILFVKGNHTVSFSDSVTELPNIGEL